MNALHAHKITTTTEIITPDIARQYLLSNTKNRPIRPGHVKRLMAMMKRGEWTLTGEPIVFSFQGELLDGQHRLMACADSGVSIPMLVVWGINPEAQKVMGDTAPRSGGDMLAMEGEAHYVLVNAGINVIHDLSVDGVWGRSNKDNPGVTHAIRGAFLLVFPELRKWARFAATHKSYFVLGSLVVGLGVVFEKSEQEPDDAKRFFTQLINGDGLERDSPIFHLREFLIRRALDKAVHIDRRTMGWYAIKAWNKYALGEPMRSIRVLSSEKPPKVFGFNPRVIPNYTTTGNLE